MSSGETKTLQEACTLVPQATYVSYYTHTYSVLVGKTLTTGCLNYPTHARIWGLKEEGINSKGKTKGNYKYSIGSTCVRCLLPVHY